MLAGLALAYFALHGWDKKYGAFGGSFAGLGGIPVKPVTPVVPAAPAAAVTGKTA
jgi:hypothetical protein